MSMRKYRGGDVNVFFSKIVEEAEKCFPYDDEKVQGKNYPY